MTAIKKLDPDFLSLIPDQGMDDHIASLRYAGMIQNALMPDPKFLRGYLQDFFVLFLPGILSAEIFITPFVTGRRCAWPPVIVPDMACREP